MDVAPFLYFLRQFRRRRSIHSLPSSSSSCHRQIHDDDDDGGWEQRRRVRYERSGNRMTNMHDPLAKQKKQDHGCDLSVSLDDRTRTSLFGLKDMLIKLTNGKVSTKHQFDDDCSYIAFIQAASEVVHIPEVEIELLVGFPPKLLQPSDPNELVRNLGVVSGTAVTVRPNPDRRNTAGILKDMGFPSHVIVQVIHSMKTLTLDEAVELCSLAVSSNGGAREKKMVIWTIPADNSCLFNAIDFLVNSPADLRGPGHYRRTVADVILANPALYSEDFLEKKPSEYVTWILHPDKWGGEIELSILSTQLTIEIAVVDIQTGISLVYGSGSGFDRRIFLIYDGSHYDAVVRSTDLVHSPPQFSCIERSFAAGTDDLLEEVKELALDRRKKRQFTNLRSGSLLCKQCDCVLTGQKEAVEHAKQTGHTNFGEVV